jgi:hypothetical protein
VEYIAARDRNCPDDSEWRVEAHDAEGECFTAIFIGRDAKDRAEQYARLRNGALSSRVTGLIVAIIAEMQAKATV